jgi:hypothetical protein
MRELLTEYEFPGDEIPVTMGRLYRLLNMAVAIVSAHSASQVYSWPTLSTPIFPSPSALYRPILMRSRTFSAFSAVHCLTVVWSAALSGW